MSQSVNCERSPSGDVPELLRQAREGSAEALGELLEGCRQYLLVVANEELEPDLVAKTGGSDLVQETFLRAQRNMGSFDGSSEIELLAWLRQILRNHLATLRRRFYGTYKRDLHRELTLNGDVRNADYEKLTSNTGSPSSHAARCEEVYLLDCALSRLSKCYRRVIQLRHREGLSFAEVGRHLHISTPAARKLWARAIKRLRKELNPVTFNVRE